MELVTDNRAERRAFWKTPKPAAIPRGHCSFCKGKLPDAFELPERLRPWMCEVCSRDIVIRLRGGVKGTDYSRQQPKPRPPSTGCPDDSEWLALVVSCPVEPHPPLSGRAIRLLLERGQDACDDCRERDAIEAQAGVDAIPCLFAYLNRIRAERLGKYANNATLVKPDPPIEHHQGLMF